MQALQPVRSPVTPGREYGPTGPLDGPLGGKGTWRCNRTACQIRIGGDRWWNTSTRAWYCRSCALRINDACLQHREPFLCFPEGLPR